MNKELADDVRRTAKALCEAMSAASDAGLEVTVLLYPPNGNYAPAHPLHGKFFSSVEVKKVDIVIF